MLLGTQRVGKDDHIKADQSAAEAQQRGSSREWAPPPPVRCQFALRRGIGYVIQDIGLFPHYTVERNISLVPRIEGWQRKESCSRLPSYCS